MIASGEDPDELNFEGTDLDRRVTNKGTNVLIVRQFMEECIKAKMQLSFQEMDKQFQALMQRAVSGEL